MSYLSTPTQVRLSKSKFVAGIQCLKRLYYQIHQPELAELADDGQVARLEQGNEVGLLAQSRFPRGVLVGFEGGTEGALAHTASLLEDPSIPAIFEAAFQHQGVLVRVDILERRPGNRWRLIEVKSALDVKDYYLNDVAIQANVLRNCGLDISSACLMHLNRSYVYDGRRYDPKELFNIEDLTTQVRERDAQIPALLKAQWKALAQPYAPDISPGRHCSNPFPCEFSGHCNPPLPEYHISSIPKLSDKKHANLLELGITMIRDIPDNFPLTENQSRVWSAVKTLQPWISDDLAKEVSCVKYPLYFMDFETLFPAIPRFAGMWPYSHIPFQWSVHRQMSADGELEHAEYLGETLEDPRREFIESLCSALGTKGLIITYNAHFESQRLGDLATWFPEYAERITKIQARLWDLWPFVKKHVYHHQFHGSFSLKSILPALVPELSYEGMEVSHGGEAGLVWDEMIRGDIKPAERQRLKSALLAYCRQDTLAMTKILTTLRTIQ